MGKENEKITDYSDKCAFTEIYRKKNGLVNPALVTFQNGDLKDDRSDLNVALMPTNKGTSIEVGTCLGHVFRETVFSKNPDQNLFVAIRSKTSNKIRLIEVDNVVLINSALVTNPVVNITAPTYNKEIKTLYSMFGGKKAVSQVVRAEKLNFGTMPVADELKQTIAEMKVESEISFNESEAESIIDLLPPCHRDSTTVSNVYQMKEILSETELEALMEEVKIMEENKFNTKEYSEFFMKCYAEVKKSNENLQIRLAGVLFADILIKFLKVPSRNLTLKKTIMWPFAAVIREKLINEFCIKTEFSVTRPQAMRDKCICYIITICLICCNYQINLQSLQTAITSLHMNRLLRLTKLVGAVPASKQGYLYTLKLPLPSPPKSQKGRPQRK